ncbi:Tyrosine recombinase XerD (fragment) [Candidatus Methylobacter favarea]|uniref:Tyrosine recombinase XerD n=1 Tax=Candidatus Methylobacter favarea TaxID=2707345 RepID=A0A8S0WD59_9GAMM
MPVVSERAPFFYLPVFGRDSFGVKLLVPKQEQRIPELLMRSEVSRILAAHGNLKHCLLLTTCYGCGLRVNKRV